MSGAEWTVPQLIALDRMSGALAIPEIVDEVNARGPEHTERALVQHASQTGISLARRARQDPWDDEQDAIIRQCAGTMTTAEIADEIRRRTCWVRTAGAIKRHARRKLGISFDRTWLSIREIAAILPMRRGLLAELLCHYVAPVRKSEQNDNEQSRFSAQDVERFIQAHPWLFDWREVRGRQWQEIARLAWARSRWLTVDQAAEALGESPQWVRSLAATGRLGEAMRLGRRWRIPAAAVVEHQRSRQKKRARAA
jgi:excisionase family DNA binding protein